jgi:HPt (histidine-containing phosphotransfer) domain-containing protein
MTLGDKQLLENILSRFREDCLADIDELERSIADGELPTCRLIIHRLAGRIAQIGSKKLGADFRKMEQEIDEHGELKAKQLQEINILLAKLKGLVAETKKKDYSML